MTAILDQAAMHWAHIAPLLDEPESEADYDAKVEALDELLDAIGDDEQHSLASLAARLGDVIKAYDETHRPMSDVAGIDVLRYLMREHGVNQSQLPEIGAQSVVSSILSGRRTLNWRQICALSERFGVPTDAFKDR
ncbi:MULTISPECIES: helix-turn-helix domain-containing protein [Alloalcanivorax]|jgi:HTH-type transcriptional regulator / antitoxin HigA|uniref:Transcriptional regulator n=2 Tax=Alloalcanivorax TaxID=3020832 RepID=A0A9Q3ZFY6_9GAMM|nr:MULTISPECIES: transcriptional regulator [Alloalcanivorax]KYZ87343.1 transcriptional regulator [Alcanivorax sp. KX64203]ARB46057.1 transcriptional regulator [Alloalcanivorax xenomutans]MCE7508709.1 transcriptional regulator [Alloalcanivorax xenomutans]MCE7521902.1 transcriptional regulator [Alloalcanivorax xenomutans]MCU5783058.1 HTH-type transcriptional regulator [Alloalcanivorax balearicus MACL04]